MRKKPNAKLTLSRETLRLLSGNQLIGIAGRNHLGEGPHTSDRCSALCTRNVCTDSDCDTYCVSCYTNCVTGCGC
jgi:hypothetical protein